MAELDMVNQPVVSASLHIQCTKEEREGAGEGYAWEERKDSTQRISDESQLWQVRRKAKLRVY